MSHILLNWEHLINTAREDLINELIVTTIPILLGGGHSLFGDLDQQMAFDLVKSEVFLDAIVQSTYKRKKKLNHIYFTTRRCLTLRPSASPS